MNINNSCLTIKEASLKEAIKILSEPQLLAILPVDNLQDLPDYILSMQPSNYIVKLGKYSLLFTHEDLGKGVYEIHISCPKASVPASRLLAVAMLRWVATTGSDSKARAITTNCPEGIIANFCRKCGGIEIGRIEKTTHFMMDAERLR